MKLNIRKPNNPKGLIESKIHDKHIVDFCIKKNIPARLAPDGSDIYKKVDIIVKNHKIDTKIFGHKFSKTNLYYEFKKHSENGPSEAEYLWIFIKTKEDENKLISESYLVSIEKLRELCKYGKCKKWTAPSGDLLMTFDLTKLELYKDYLIYKNIPEISYIN